MSVLLGCNSSLNEARKAKFVVERTQTREIAESAVHGELKVCKQAICPVKWKPALPKDFDVNNVAVGSLPLLIDENVTKDEFEAFFKDSDSKTHEGCQWGWQNGKPYIYEIPTNMHERAGSAFQIALVAALGNSWSALYFDGSARWKNPDPNGSNWEGDISVVPKGRRGNNAAASGKLNVPYPTLIFEAALSESDEHIVRKCRAYVTSATTIQIALALLIRPHRQGADSLKILKIQQGRGEWECSFGNCDRPMQPEFELRLPVLRLFEGAQVPESLNQVQNICVDLFSIKSYLDELLLQVRDQEIAELGKRSRDAFEPDSVPEIEDVNTVEQVPSIVTGSSLGSSERGPSTQDDRSL